jgi:hypothetical protein
MEIYAQHKDVAQGPSSLFQLIGPDAQVAEKDTEAGIPFFPSLFKKNSFMSAARSPSGMLRGPVLADSPQLRPAKLSAAPNATSRLKVVFVKRDKRKFLEDLKKWVRKRVKNGVGWIKEEIPFPNEAHLPETSNAYFVNLEGYGE